MPISRRKAREAALQALYEIEVGRNPLEEVLNETLMAQTLEPSLEAYTERLVRGVHAELAFLRHEIAARLNDYSWERLGIVDRTVLLIAAYELFFVPEIPPAVSIDEAIEIGRKYSTQETGRFVNGVLGAVLLGSPKADWSADNAPAEFQPEEPSTEEPAVIEEVTVQADSEEGKTARRFGWVLRSETVPD